MPTHHQIRTELQNQEHLNVYFKQMNSTHLFSKANLRPQTLHLRSKQGLVQQAV
jgi:hypothetical protein